MYTYKQLLSLIFFFLDFLVLKSLFSLTYIYHLLPLPPKHCLFTKFQEQTTSFTRDLFTMQCIPHEFAVICIEFAVICIAIPTGNQHVNTTVQY